jgi:hypothetical protein
VGTKGTMLIPHIGWPDLHPKSDYAGLEFPDVGRADHWLQFVDAILGKEKTSTGFEYSGPLTEAVLLGSVASRFPKTTLEWDAAALKFSNVEAANAHVRRANRAGWSVAGL